MITKTEICDAVTFLLRSATDRETSQGIVVYTKVLEMFDDAQDEEVLLELLQEKCFNYPLGLLNAMVEVRCSNSVLRTNGSSRKVLQ